MASVRPVDVTAWKSSFAPCKIAPSGPQAAAFEAGLGRKRREDRHLIRVKLLGLGGVSRPNQRPPERTGGGVIFRRKLQRRAEFADGFGRPAHRHARESKIEMRAGIRRPLLHVVRPNQLRILILRIA